MLTFPANKIPDTEIRKGAPWILPFSGLNNPDFPIPTSERRRNSIPTNENTGNGKVSEHFIGNHSALGIIADKAGTGDPEQIPANSLDNRKPQGILSTAPAWIWRRHNRSWMWLFREKKWDGVGFSGCSNLNLPTGIPQNPLGMKTGPGAWISLWKSLSLWNWMPWILLSYPC